MVNPLDPKQRRALRTTMLFVAIAVMAAEPALAQEGSVLSSLQNQITTAAKGWETTVMDAAKSLFWILASIEIGIAAVWLALQAASLDGWFAELIRRIMFVGFFAFVLAKGPTFAKAVVDSLFQIGAGGGTASPADVFNAGLAVATKMSEKIQFGLFDDNALAISAAFAMVVVVICFSLVAAIFVSVMVEMYLGLLAGMIMLGLGGSSYTKDFAVRYLVYAFSVGMKLMALVMISRIGSEVLIGLANEPEVGNQFQTALAIAGIAVVIFIIAIYVPNIIQGVVQGASVSGGMEAIRHGGQTATFAAGGAFLGASAARTGAQAASAARAGGSSMAGAALRGMASGIRNAGWAAGSAAKEKAIASPGAYAGSLLGLANAKLDHAHSPGMSAKLPTPPPLNENK
ncbi:P-type conjugative transfer protein TrbL [Mesorhizobium sp. M2D.F.Ca.ET.185.01.1.1]|uniref:P-type conjugative transfer protein TrbL n=1 Tax=unclassified Mesorhizobium TaxID=325217 RepID=UPI000FCBD1A9|nr:MULTISPECIES: P-type conjugative transfer protein TrbL [unclassified Mesorhizobium]TGP77251.1 P-type conjugative transfer protein TrbL [bacterium M00.F.Ca.ET.227.01.1.1]TGP93044.1 P-type conjugative transfer protein TrbL [bacterium M00.F.Ca.ET.222.01.1.1]TGP96590.1 P-type conjugative transfer protein TrbL [bacterium M00.F.Ca.ET.221.01.1.1]TGT96057.1 P-type conjugative transfer protein TrbL [bacterium M00.F.Ca.ET.163.01.1.1]TGU20799.1 P-type conjugative transfer protein TrbL [bacterium M00.F